MTVFGAPTDPKTLAAFAETGVERVVFVLPNAGADKVLPALDRLAKLRG